MESLSGIILAFGEVTYEQDHSGLCLTHSVAYTYMGPIIKQQIK